MVLEHSHQSEKNSLRCSLTLASTVLQEEGWSFNKSLPTFDSLWLQPSKLTFPSSTCSASSPWEREQPARSTLQPRGLWMANASVELPLHGASRKPRRL